MEILKFEEYNAKMKYITRVSSDGEVAELLKIPAATYSTKKKNDDIPIEATVKYFEDKCVDLNWLFKSTGTAN